MILPNKLLLNWLKLGIFSLAGAGFYSIILVILRTPFLKELLKNSEIFKASLIVHVNLSVLIWLLSMTAVIWCHNKQVSMMYMMLSRLGQFSGGLIFISPIFGGHPIMNNYVPILENIVFVIGISLFLITILIFAISNLKTLILNYIDIVIVTSSLMFIISCLSFLISIIQLKIIIELVEVEIEYYYELLFWSFGHILQFIYTQLIMTVWLFITEACMKKSLKFEKWYIYIFVINLIFASFGIIGHVYDIISPEFKNYYTDQMKYLGGVAPLSLLTLIMLELGSSVRYNNLFIIIFLSNILFLFGGIIALFINGQNVTIPAHYHGMIVGITIAFMGFVYILCNDINKLEGKEEKFNIRSLIFLAKNNNLFKSQLVQLSLITIGQIMHIGGLAMAGGYGALRKDPNIIMSTFVKIAMIFMGIGGIIAIIGGLMFVYICIKKIYFQKGLS